MVDLEGGKEEGGREREKGEGGQEGGRRGREGERGDRV